VSTAVFGSAYAAAYDQLYQDKDYTAECDLIESLFARFALRPVQRLLDLGCGTGSHAVPLSVRGYEVVGVDRAPDMLEVARARGDARIQFELGDVTSVRLGETFDAVLMMFAVLGYQVPNADLAAALETARAHLEPGGLFVFDVWYGPAVLAQRPSERVKVIDQRDGQVIRVASGELDVRQNACTVRYRVWSIVDGVVTAEIREEHSMRYFFEPELAALLATAGFEMVHVGAFPEVDSPPDESTWNVAVVARAV
jgi:SAM-dependent methyltransferase